jgi:PII-like signaling protein
MELKTMALQGEAQLLRIYIGEHDIHNHKPLYEVIVEMAKEAGLAGASVFKGVLSYGASNRIHTAKIFELSQDLPMVIEIVDKTEAIYAFLHKLDELLESAGCGGLVTIETLKILKYAPKSGEKK